MDTLLPLFSPTRAEFLLHIALNERGRDGRKEITDIVKVII